MKLWCESSASSSTRTSCGPENLDGRPSPEGAFFFEGEIASSAGGQVGHIDPARDRVPALQFLAVNVDHLARCGGQRCIEPCPGGLKPHDK
jgi:hypothetical protein